MKLSKAILFICLSFSLSQLLLPLLDDGICACLSISPPSENLLINTRFRHLTPLMEFQPEDPSTVQEIVRCAARHSKHIAVRSGGHSYIGSSSCDGCVVINLARMNRTVAIDPLSKTLTVQAGMSLGSLYEILGSRNWTAAAGSCPDVAIGGHSVVGGVGKLSRTLGLFVDSILEYQIVDPEGRLVTASSTLHEDLYWGLRGGGTSFGVVTQIRMQAYDSSELVTEFFWKGAKGDPIDFVLKILQWAPKQDPRMNFCLVVPSTMEELQITGTFWGPKSDLEMIFQTSGLFTESGADIQLFELLYHQNILQHKLTEPHSFVAGGHWIKSAEDLTLQRLEELFNAASRLQGGSWPWLQFTSLGSRSAVNQRLQNHTAFPHRGMDWLVQSYSACVDQQLCLDTFATFSRDVTRMLGEEGYLGYPNESLRDSALSYWGPNLDRLQQVKAKYNPSRLFFSRQDAELRPIEGSRRQVPLLLL